MFLSLSIFIALLGTSVLFIIIVYRFAAKYVDDVNSASDEDYNLFTRHQPTETSKVEAKSIDKVDDKDDNSIKLGCFEVSMTPKSLPDLEEEVGFLEEVKRSEDFTENKYVMRKEDSYCVDSFMGKWDNKEQKESSISAPKSGGSYLQHYASINVSIEDKVGNPDKDGLVRFLVDQIEFLKEELREKNGYIRMLLARYEK